MGLLWRDLAMAHEILLCLLVVSAMQGCNGQDIKLEGKEFHCVSEKLTWVEAEKNCRSMGMRLAITKHRYGRKLTNQLHDECCKKIKPDGACWLWLGAKMEKWGNYFRWTDGSVLAMKSGRQASPGWRIPAIADSVSTPTLPGRMDNSTIQNATFAAYPFVRRFQKINGFLLIEDTKNKIIK